MVIFSSLKSKSFILGYVELYSRQSKWDIYYLHFNNRSINEYYAKCDGCLVKYKKGIVCFVIPANIFFTGIINKVTKSYVRNVEQLKGKGLFAHCE